MKNNKARRGNAVVVMVSSGAMIGFGALAVDVGIIRLTRTELQASVDAAALSATTELNGTVAGIDRARARATQVALANSVSGGPINILPAEVRIGWYNAYGTFVPWTPGLDPGRVDTLGVRHRPHEVPSGLGGLAFGIHKYNVSAPSTARRPMDGASSRTAPCWLPLAVPSCWVDGLAPKTNPKPIEFAFSPTPSDKIAWGDPGGNPNSATLKAQLIGQCAHQPLHVGQQMYVNEGLHTTALQEVRDIINGSASAPADIWNTEAYGPIPPRSGTPTTANNPSNSGILGSRWGRTLEGVVPLVDGGDDCTKLSFTGSKTIKRFAWAVIYDASVTGKDKNIYVQIDMVLPHVIWGEADSTIQSNVLTRGTATLAELDL